jgi:hypothetical protein
MATEDLMAEQAITGSPPRSPPVRRRRPMRMFDTIFAADLEHAEDSPHVPAEDQLNTMSGMRPAAPAAYLRTG